MSRLMQMNLRAWSLVVAVGGGVGFVDTAVGAENQNQQGPELRRLQAFVGGWRTEEKFHPMEWAPRQNRGKGYMTGRWTLNGSFMNTEYHSTGNTGPYSGASMFTYDPDKKAYRLWWFDSRGGGQEFVGRWDEAKRSFILQAKSTDRQDRPVVKRVTYRLADKKTIQFKLEFAYQGKDFKTYIESTYTKTN